MYYVRTLQLKLDLLFNWPWLSVAAGSGSGSISYKGRNWIWNNHSGSTTLVRSFVFTAQARLLKQPKGSLHIPILKKELEALQMARDEERTTFITDRLKDIPRYTQIQIHTWVVYFKNLSNFHKRYKWVRHTSDVLSSCIYQVKLPAGRQALCCLEITGYQIDAIMLTAL
jgi:hypothetical protein